MFVYSAYEPDTSNVIYLWEAAISAISLRRHTDAPIKLHTNLADVENLLGALGPLSFDEIVINEEAAHPKILKIDAIKSCLGDQCIYLDTHTIVLGNIHPVFKIDDFDIAGVHAPWRDGQDGTIVDKDFERGFLQTLNTGALWVNLKKSRRFLQTWSTIFRKDVKAGNPNAKDQAAFLHAARDINPSLLYLPENYNFRAHYGGRLSGRCYVVHSHYWTKLQQIKLASDKRAAIDDLIDRVDAKVNKSSTMRVFLPASQRDLSLEEAKGKSAPASTVDRIQRANKLGLINFERVSSVIDVGVGYTGTGFLVKSLPKKNFICIEPNISLEGSVEQHYPKGRSQFFYLAAGNQEGEMELNIPAGDSNKSSLFRPNSLSPASLLESESISVQVRRLDSLRSEFSYSGPYLLKIDAEGAELDVLLGAAGILEEIEILIVEVSFLVRYEGSYSFSDLVCRCKEFGFEPVDICYIPPLSLDHMPIRRVDMVFTRTNGL
jgi:FkbM family methyltransferase